MNNDLSNCIFPRNKEEAEKYFKNYEHFDPFPWIPPALLNSADIYNYARVTGMVFPFEGNPVKNKLKSASYEIDFLGEVYYWENKNNKDHLKIEIKKHDPFTIPKNSIVFVSPKTIFRLPDYIALRFNLRIKHVHRGLLLGTGPLVDPGFEGRLFIPLHNLTSEDYTIIGGEGLIWVEFTKLSPHNHWINDRTEHEGYNHFPAGSKNRDPQEYLNASSNGKPARSSIPGEMDNAMNIIHSTSREVDEKFKNIRNWTIGGGLILVIALLSLSFQVTDLILTANQNVKESTNQNTSLREKQFKLNQRIESLEAQIQSLTESLEKANKDLSLNAPKRNPNK